MIHQWDSLKSRKSRHHKSTYDTLVRLIDLAMQSILRRLGYSRKRSGQLSQSYPTVPELPAQLFYSIKVSLIDIATVLTIFIIHSTVRLEFDCVVDFLVLAVPPFPQPTLVVLNNGPEEPQTIPHWHLLDQIMCCRGYPVTRWPDHVLSRLSCEFNRTLKSSYERTLNRSSVMEYFS